jgi:hypothetical protein
MRQTYNASVLRPGMLWLCDASTYLDRHCCNVLVIKGHDEGPVDYCSLVAVACYSLRDTLLGYESRPLVKPLQTTATITS